MICPKCNGDKELRIAFPHSEKCTLPCIQCNAKGIVPEEMTQWIEDGKILKDKRIAKKITLRNMARQLEGDVLENAMKISEMERGVIKPDMSIYDNLKGR